MGVVEIVCSMSRLPMLRNVANVVLGTGEEFSKIESSEILYYNDTHSLSILILH